MTAASVLSSLTILLEMHVEVILELLLAGMIIDKPETTLSALRSETVVLQIRNCWRMPDPTSEKLRQYKLIIIFTHRTTSLLVNFTGRDRICWR
jgi:hypothetical protein